MITKCNKIYIILKSYQNDSKTYTVASHVGYDIKTSWKKIRKTIASEIDNLQHVLKTKIVHPATARKQHQRKQTKVKTKQI